ncbi:unnamed protein product [Cylicostephanus goldi]|uniref:Uncharacterized protein n=1 Tax=Cylicostephanus goldi TaxID=71465 RepID=A0A3P7MH46_CYLGO|nr:unnamed protein product [Cylicostephanus goldi]
MQNFAARQHSQHPSPAYFRHQLESDRTALTLLGMISALQQQQRQSAANMGRYHADLDGQEGDSSELTQVQLQQLQQLNTAQLISLLGTNHGSLWTYTGGYSKALGLSEVKVNIGVLWTFISCGPYFVIDFLWSKNCL